MRVTLFGTRGSVPAPGPETARYGGNTPSVEVRGGDGTLLVLDAGTGIRRLGAQMPPGVARVDILLTHLHMDHIQGLGFFGPLYHPGIEVHIWGPASSTLPLEARLSRYLSPPLFPVHLRDLPRITCHEVPARALRARPVPDPHRAGLPSQPDRRLPHRGAGPQRRLPARPRAGARPRGRPLARAGMDLGLRPRRGRRSPDPRRPVHRRPSTRAASAGATAPTAMRSSSPPASAPRRSCCSTTTRRTTTRCSSACSADALRRFKPAFRVSAGCEGAVFELGACAAPPSRAAR